MLRGNNTVIGDRKMRKKLTSLALLAVMVLGLAAPAAAAGTFSDVPENAWYAADVQDVQKYGIIEGVGGGRFAPTRTLTCAQAIAMAARTHAHIYNNVIPAASTESDWVDPYLDYALEHGVAEEGMLPMQPPYLDTACARELMALMFYRVIEKENNPILNRVTDIPDIGTPEDDPEVYSLYRFGILTGSDQYGAFYPNRSISRAEAAVILNRLLDQGKRKTFSLLPASPMQYLDQSKCWSYTRDDEYFGLYRLLLSFFPDGTFYGLFFTPNTGYIESLKGYYSVSGRAIDLEVYWPYEEPHPASYRMVLDSWSAVPGFRLIQRGEHGIFTDHTDGSALHFQEVPELSAEECKTHCLELWGIEKQ